MESMNESRSLFYGSTGMKPRLGEVARYRLANPARPGVDVEQLRRLRQQGTGPAYIPITPRTIRYPTSGSRG